MRTLRHGPALRCLLWISVLGSALASSNCGGGGDTGASQSAGSTSSGSGGQGGASACQPGETKECYAGPDGTKGVGECRAGTQTCASGTFGACTGEVLPAAEVCNGKDDDCNGQVDEGSGQETCGV